MRSVVTMTVCLFVVLAASGGLAAEIGSGSQDVTVNYAKTTGRFSDYLSGTTEGPFFSQDSHILLQEGGFKLAQVTIWLSGPEGGAPRPPEPERRQGRPPFPGNSGAPGGPRPDISLQTAKDQVRSLVRLGIQPLIFMTAHSKPGDLAQFRDQVVRTTTDLRRVAADEGKDLLLFRFGNEPDSKRFWTGTREDYFETYRTWANAVKSVSPTFVLEAPALASATGRHLNDDSFDAVNDFTKEFLLYCRKNQVPLDVFSFHYYGTSIENLQKEISAVRAELAKYQGLSPLFGQPKFAIDEWNIEVFGLESNRYQKVFDTPHTAAHNVAALITLAKNDGWLSVRFGGPNFRRQEGGEPRFGNGPMKGPVTDFLMVDRGGRPKPVYFGFQAFNRLGATPELIEVTEGKGIYALAGKSKDGRTVNIVLSFYNADLARQALQENRSDLAVPGNGPAEIRLKNLPWQMLGNKGMIEIYTIDEDRGLTITGKHPATELRTHDDLLVRLKRTTPSVLLVRLTW